MGLPRERYGMRVRILACYHFATELLDNRYNSIAFDDWPPGQKPLNV